MASLTTDQVSTIEANIVSRANAAIADLESQKSVAGYFTGNNGTVEQTESALRTVISTSGPWAARGNALAAMVASGRDIDDNGLDLDTAVSNWQAAGQEFIKAISEIDGAGHDATLDAVVSQTIKQTVVDVANKAKDAANSVLSALPWWVWTIAAASLAVGVVAYVVPLAKRLTPASA